MALYKNEIQLRGFVGKSAETKSTASGTKFTVFSLATQSSYIDKQSNEWISHTEWHRIIAFGKVAEYASLLAKGDYVEVEGELRSSTYETESAGDSKRGKRRRWEIRASRIHQLDRPVPPAAASSSGGSAA
jgi:single-strand DNA-binding protein